MLAPTFYALAALFLALFSMFRYSISLGLLERPLLVGLVWASITGEWATAMSIAIFFELGWLDQIPAGTYIPPHLTAATAAALALSSGLGLNLPGEVFVAILASIPLAWIGRRGEAALRERNSCIYNRSLLWAAVQDSTPFPERLIYRAMAWTFLTSLVGFFILILGIHFLLGLILPHIAALLAGLKVSWAHLWMGASIGGLLSLRIRRAYAVCAAAVVLIVLFTGPSLL